MGSAALALALGACTLRRRAGPLPVTARVALALVPLAAVAAGGVLTAQHVLGEQAAITTDDARIDGDRISIVAPTTGTLVDWSATHGSTVRKDQPVGRIRITGGFQRPTMVVRAPADGTVVVDSRLKGNLVTAGTELAVAYDLSAVRVTARVDETAVRDVRVGQPVDISVDAYPGVTLAGTVREVRATAARQPSAEETGGNYRPATQVVPVDIAIADRGDRTLVPGMSVTVRIHRDR